MNLGIPYLGFWASAQPSGVLPLLAGAFSLQNRGEGGIDHLAWRGGGGLNSCSPRIHFHLNQPLTAKSQ
jgi:hypothetical protein